MDNYNLHLYNIRLEKKMKRRQFAKFLGLRSFSYSLIEQGYIKPNKKQTEKISKALEEDYRPYLEGDYSYPLPLPEDPDSKFRKKLYSFLGKLGVRISVGVLLLASLATLFTGFYFSNQFEQHVRDYYDQEYVDFYDALTAKGQVTLTITGDLTRPEIYLKDTTRLYSIKGSYTSSGLTAVNAVATYHTDIGRTSYSFFLATSPLSITAYYADYATGDSYSVSYTEPSKDQYEWSSTFYSSSNEDQSQERLDEVKAITDSHLSELNPTFDQLIQDKLELSYSFYDGVAADLYSGSKKAGHVSSIGLFLTVLGALLSAAFLFLLIYCLLYGKRKKKETPFTRIEVNQVTLERAPHVKKDFAFSPFIPETVFEIVGILFVFFGTLRVLYYVGVFFNLIPISGNDFTTIPNTLFYLFMIGMFLLYFIDFDVFLEDKRVFRNVFLYFIIYLVLYFVESSLMTAMTTSDAIIVSELGNKISIPNNFGTITCYFLMMITLFYTPKKIKSRKGIIAYRLLTLIPIGIIVSFTLIFHYANTAWGWNLPIKVLYIFSSERTQFSLLCVTYLLGLYFLKLFYEKKYGKEKAYSLMYGNRFLLSKNAIASIAVFLIGLMEIILYKNKGAGELGLGKYPFLILLSPFLLLYHPHMGKRNTALDYTTLVLYILAFAGGYLLILIPLFLLFFLSL
jgi:transcriptional regulator with XRE-family HTH domain